MKTIAFDGFAAVKILENTIESDGMLKWQVLHISPFAKETEGETAVGTPDQLRMYFLEQEFSATEWEVLIEHSQGRLWVPIMEWLKNGPGPRLLLSPSTVRRVSSKETFPVWCVIPLRYRNSRLSRLLISIGFYKNPWQAWVW